MDSKIKLNIGCGFRYNKGDAWENVDVHSHPPFVKQVNLWEGLPYPDNSFEFVYTSHVLDHFPIETGQFLMREVCRCLKPGGVFRISLPDLEVLTRNYIKSVELNQDNPVKHHWYMIELLDQLTRTESGGQKASFLKAARGNVENQKWLRPILSSELLQLLDKPDVTPHSKINIKSFIKNLFRKSGFEVSGERHFWTYDWQSLSYWLRQNGFSKIEKMTYNNSLYKEYLSENLDIQDNKEYKPGSLYVECMR